MTPEEQLRFKVRQYQHLKEMQDSIKGRLEQLGKEIKAELDEGKHQIGDIEVTIQVKNRTSIDEAAFWDHFGRDGRYYAKFVPDPDVIEQAYLNEEINDTDLRAIREPKYSVALITRKVIDVQS